MENVLPKISLMIHTASIDSFLINQGIGSYFTALIDCLNHQSFKQFELVYIDTYHDKNQELFSNLISKSKFTIKHVPVHKDHRYWYDLGYTYISAAKNTGILYADGELLVTCDDGEFFPENLLQKYWDHYSTGCYLLPLHKRMRSINVENNLPIYPLNGDVYINDHRHNFGSDIICHQHGSWAYAGTSFSLKDALILNGFNERMDGCKSLEDCEFGIRLTLLGKQFSCDKEAFLYILDHKSYGDVPPYEEVIGPDFFKDKKKITNFIAVENYGSYMCAVELLELKANRLPLVQKHFDIIKRETLHYRGFDPFAPDNKEKMDIWLQVPCFDLKKQRDELRKSGDWKW